jgi:hypothetical protein
MRDVYCVVQLLLTCETPGTVRAWLIGTNPQLNDEAPVEVLHHDQPGRALRAAKAFVTGN